MKQLKYDVLVIGSGLGGLTSAALLSKAGYKTLVVEKMPFTGGRCATLDYHGYKLPLGVMTVEDEIHGELCREVGAGFELIVTHPMYYYRIKGKDYPAPSPGVMKTMIGEASGDPAEADRVLRAYKRCLTWADPSNSMSLQDWLKQYTDNPIVLGIFQSTVGIMSCMRISDLPAGEYFRMLQALSFASTAGFLPHSGGSLVEALVQAVERMGGEVWTRCPAVKINIKNDTAAGAAVRKNNEEIEVVARAVISNAGPRRTVQLTGREHLSPGYLRDVEAIKTVPVITIYAASDKLFVEGLAYLTVPGSQRIICIDNYPGSVFPEMVPKGKHLITVSAFPASSEPPYDFKKDVESALQELKEIIADFDKHAKILRIGTYHGEWGVMPWPGYSLPIKTPVEGLYLAGDASAPPGWWGSVAAVKSGRLVVEDIARRFKPA